MRGNRYTWVKGSERDSSEGSGIDAFFEQYTKFTMVERSLVRVVCLSMRVRDCA